MRLLDQRGDDRFGVLACHSHQHDVARLAFHQRGDLAVVTAEEESPSQWPGTARSSTAAGRSRIDTVSLMRPWSRLRV